MDLEVPFMALAHIFRDRLRSSRRSLLALIGGQVVLGGLCVVAYAREASDVGLGIWILLVALMVGATAAPVYFTAALISKENVLRLLQGDRSGEYGTVPRA